MGKERKIILKASYREKEEQSCEVMRPVSFYKFDFETMQCFYIIMKQQNKNTKHNENNEAN